MGDHAERAKAFAALHVPGKPVVLYNVWDAGSARIVAAAGARALATGSWSVAAAAGFEDGQHIPFPALSTIVDRIARATPLPLTVDLEAGYAADAEAIASRVMAVASSGAVGVNLEDGIPASDGATMQPPEHLASCIVTMRPMIDLAFRSFYINARTDVFLIEPPERHDARLVDAALERLRAYVAAGASGVFVPGLRNLELIATVCGGIDAPVNVMARDGDDLRALARAGVARISFGPAPYRRAMAALADGARAAFAALQ